MSDTDGKSKEEPVEARCGLHHYSLEEAMVCAEIELGFRDRVTKTLVVQLKPYLGTTKYNSGTVVGWQVGPKRFRADVQTAEAKKKEEERAKRAGREVIYKGRYGVHVNQEDFSGTRPVKVCHATESPVVILEHTWRRWSSKYGRPGTVKKEDIEIVDGVRER
jgi:hypothetical protein